MLFEPGLSTDNLGDQIIVDGVKAAFKQIMDGAFIIEISTHMPIYNRHMKHCEKADLKIICGSNLLVGNLGSYLHFRFCVEEHFVRQWWCDSWHLLTA